jgi:3-hydroxyacyl-CoA dehydrogenase
MSSLISVTLQQQVAVVSVNNPPVNALSVEVRTGLLNAISNAQADEKIRAIVIICEGRTFIAGADIKEFGQAPKFPHLPDVVLAIANSSLPTIAAIHGTVLGGGCEIALACRYRVGIKGTKLGLPEVNLGLIPGAGGTQLLPRVVGLSKAIDMIITGKPIQLPHTPDSALLHAVTDNGLLECALTFAQSIINDGIYVKPNFPPVSHDDVHTTKQYALNHLLKKRKGQEAPLKALEAVLTSTQTSLEEGMKKERELFIECRDSSQSVAMRYAFFAEKRAEKATVAPHSVLLMNINKVTVIGAGTMGAGIAMCLLGSGLQVYLLEINPENLDRGLSYIRDTLASSVKKGRITEQQSISQLLRLTATTKYAAIADSHLVIEAAFESMAVKQDIFAKLDKTLSADCILASNTSYLNIDEIASVVKHKERVIGLHFFSPAHIMKLLEIVKTKHVESNVVASCMAFAKKINKQAALVGMCYGFVGNRMFASYGREANFLLLEGCTPEQIDNALVHFGMAMGPLAVNDMSGIDIAYKARKENSNLTTDPSYFIAANLMVESGRLGQKTSAGFYVYDDKKRRFPDTSINDVFKRAAEELNIEPQSYTDEEISERLVLALINEGTNILLEGIADNAEIIDTIWLNGYGFPRYKGGPMFYAQQLGWQYVKERLTALHGQTGKDWWLPSAYIDRLLEGTPKSSTHMR